MNNDRLDRLTPVLIWSKVGYPHIKVFASGSEAISVLLSRIAASSPAACSPQRRKTTLLQFSSGEVRRVGVKSDVIAVVVSSGNENV